MSIILTINFSVDCLYITDISATLVGQYNIELSYNLGELNYNSNYTLDISYLPEHDSFTLYEASSLYYMVTSNGKIALDGKLKLENDNSNIQKYIIDFTPLFMAIAVSLFIIDIMVRKLRLQDVKSIFNFIIGKKISKRSDINEK